MKIISHSLEETKAFAGRFLDSFSRQKTEACIVGLYGNLGAGKTAFAQALASTLNIEETVTSPTYVIEKIYAIPVIQGDGSTAFKHLIHIDAYRLEKADELANLGWKDILKDPGNLILIEWPEKVAEILPDNHIKIHCTFIDETSREYSVL